MSSSRHPPPPAPHVTNNTGPVSIKTEAPVTGEDTAEDDIAATDQVSSYRLSRDTDHDTSSSDPNEFSLGVPPLTIGITEGNKGNLIRNKSSNFRVKLKRIKFELYTEPDLTWTLTDLSLTASPLPSPV